MRDTSAQFESFTLELWCLIALSLLFRHSRQIIFNKATRTESYLQSKFGVGVGERDTTLVDDQKLLIHTMECFRNLEECERQGSSTTKAIDNLVCLAHKMTEESTGVACELFQLILDRMNAIDFAELSKAELQYSFGKFLVSVKAYEKANQILEEALKYSEENNLRVLSKNICQVYFESLYNLCLDTKAVDGELAIQLAVSSQEVARKMNDVIATTKSFIQRGNILMSMGKYPEAIDFFQSATSELKKKPDLNLKVEILYRLSTCYFTIKDYTSCLLSLGALGRLATAYNKIEYQAHFGRIDGNVKLLMGENMIAQKKFLKSIEIYDNIGLSDYATSCRYLEAVAKCEHLVQPWISILINAEKQRPFEERFEFNDPMFSIFNWKLRRESFCQMSDE